MIEPKSRQKFLYLTLGLAPPASRREWVEHDIASMGFLLRRALQVLIGLVLGFSISAVLVGGSGSLVLGGFLGGLFVSVLQMTVFAGYVRRRALRYYEAKWDRQRDA